MDEQELIQNPEALLALMRQALSISLHSARTPPHRRRNYERSPKQLNNWKSNRCPGSRSLR